jgi:hypothetical protein
LPSARSESDARDRAQMILGAVSLVIWFAPPILRAGGIALLVAALPWLAYKPLVRRLRQRD